MTQQERSRKARTKWRKLVFEQGRSGRSVAAFCRERELCIPHFFWWKKRLQESPAAKFVEVKVAGTALSEPHTALPSSTARDSRVEIRLRNGRSLVVGPGFDAGHLQALLAAVEAA